MPLTGFGSMNLGGGSENAAKAERMQSYLAGLQSKEDKRADDMSRER